MESSTSISSSLVAHNELLSTIASLRSQLAQTQSQLHHAQQQAGPGEPQGRGSRSRRTSTQSASNGYGYASGSGLAVSNAPGMAHRRSSSGNTSQSIGYAGAPPSSLAAASPTSYTLKRDKSYDDLNSVMSAPSPTFARKGSFNYSVSGANGAAGMSNPGLGLSRPSSAVRRRSSSTGGDSDGGRTNPAGSRIPMPVIAKGSVGTAATLAGGGSPKSPALPGSGTQNNGQQPESDGDTSFDGSRSFPNGVLQDITNGAMRAYNPEELDMSKRGPSASLPAPHSAIPRPISPLMRPAKSSRGTEAEDADDDGRQPRSATVRTSSSPFFGGGGGFTERHAARIASSQSGTSKVIMSLQTDLTNARAQLESTRTQLRASARAVEALTRQVEDHKEGRERIRIESQGVATTLSRKERMLDETLARARTAESSLKHLEDDRKVHNAECSRRIKDLESRIKEAEERKARAESEYNALKGATSSMSEGWKRELKGLKKEQATIRLLTEKDANAAKARQAQALKLSGGRLTAQDDVKAALGELRNWQDAVKSQYEAQIAQLLKQTERSESENEMLKLKTQAVLDELANYKRAMQAYDQTVHGRK